eukprot:1175752-Lingulodinium_polyedra.AAC.1
MATERAGVVLLADSKGEMAPAYLLFRLVQMGAPRQRVTIGVFERHERRWWRSRSDQTQEFLASREYSGS